MTLFGENNNVKKLWYILLFGNEERATPISV